MANTFWNYKSMKKQWKILLAVLIQPNKLSLKAQQPHLKLPLTLAVILLQRMTLLQSSQNLTTSLSFLYFRQEDKSALNFFQQSTDVFQSFPTTSKLAYSTFPFLSSSISTPSSCSVLTTINVSTQNASWCYQVVDSV